MRDNKRSWNVVAMAYCRNIGNRIIRFFKTYSGRRRSQGIFPPAEVKVEYRVLQPHQLAWMRRSEMDTPMVEVWEQPNGMLYAHPKQAPPLTLMKLCRVKDDQPVNH